MWASVGGVLRESIPGGYPAKGSNTGNMQSGLIINPTGYGTTDFSFEFYKQ